MKTVLEFFKSVRNSISKLFGKTTQSVNTTEPATDKPTIEETKIDITQETQKPLKIEETKIVANNSSEDLEIKALKIEETKIVVNQKTEETKTESKPQKVSKPKNTKASKNTKAKTSKNTKAKTSENTKTKASENKSVKKRGRPRKTA